MAITTIYTYPLTGSQREFTVPFEYLARRFVVLTLIGQDRKELVLATDFRFISKTVVQTTVPWGPADGYERIEIRRDTSATDRLVDFADGSILRASELNISQIQTMHIAEEARNMVSDTIGVNNEGMLDARARRIVNLADAREPGDAVTLRQQQTWAESALNQANRAKTEADRATVEASTSQAHRQAAESAKDTSIVYATESSRHSGDAYTNKESARVSADQAWTHRETARIKADEAYASATNAKASETNAKTSETNSAIHAANLGNAVNFYSLIDYVSAGAAYFKPGHGIQADHIKVGAHYVWHAGNFNPNLKLSVEAGFTGYISLRSPVPSENLAIEHGAYGGALEIREKASNFHASGNTVRAPGITFHYGGHTVQQLFMKADASLCWGNPYNTAHWIVAEKRERRLVSRRIWNGNAGVVGQVVGLTEALHTGDMVRLRHLNWNFVGQLQAVVRGEAHSYAFGGNGNTNFTLAPDGLSITFTEYLSGYPVIAIDILRVEE